jgi:hypothetical protein
MKARPILGKFLRLTVARSRTAPKETAPGGGPGPSGECLEVAQD